jgi:hypothetical protein
MMAMITAITTIMSMVTGTIITTGMNTPMTMNTGMRTRTIHTRMRTIRSGRVR